jgi:hypothetical protein
LLEAGERSPQVPSRVDPATVTVTAEPLAVQELTAITREIPPPIFNDKGYTPRKTT